MSAEALFFFVLLVVVVVARLLSAVPPSPLPFPPRRLHSRFVKVTDRYEPARSIDTRSIPL